MHRISLDAGFVPVAAALFSTLLVALTSGVRFRGGMGNRWLGAALCDYCCMPLFDDMNNWVADLPTLPTHMQAISEVYPQEPTTTSMPTPSELRDGGYAAWDRQFGDR